MDEKQKELLEGFFNTAQLMLAKDGKVKPLYILIKEQNAMPVFYEGQMTTEEYANTVTEIAYEQNMDAAILICEQNMVRGHKDAPEMQPYISGEKGVKEHPDCKSYLMGCFMTAEGEYETMIAEIHTELSKGTKYVFEPEWIDDTQTNYLVAWRK
jgi:hypothetical protein